MGRDVVKCGFGWKDKAEWTSAHLDFVLTISDNDAADEIEGTGERISELFLGEL